MKLKTLAVQVLTVIFALALIPLFPSTASAAEGSISIQGKTGTYTKLTDAIAAASDGDVLVVTGDVVEDTTVSVTKDITLVAGVGGGSLQIGYSAYLSNASGNKLVLGSGSASGDLLTLESSNVTLWQTNGETLIRDGVIIRNTLDTGYSVFFETGNSTGSITGGTIEGGEHALQMANGAHVTTISGGVIRAHDTALNATGTGTRIDVISGGTFTNEVNARMRSVVYVENAQIGTISGGNFTATTGSAITVMLGGWIDVITGSASLVTNQVSDPVYMRGRALNITVGGPGYGDTGVGTISGGTFSGEIAAFVRGFDDTYPAKVNSIAGGTFTGQYRGLQVDLYSQVDVIRGAAFSGNVFGVNNAGTIDAIELGSLNGGTSGLRNWSTGSIGTISGGSIVGHNMCGIHNLGAIGLISGGTITGADNAVFSNDSPAGTINVISGGVFWGKGGDAVVLGGNVSLEPGLTTEVQGMGRYWAGSGNIFNDENLVGYPAGFHMSTITEPVGGISETEFRYLTKTLAIKYDRNGGMGEMADMSGEYKEKMVIRENAFTHKGRVFKGWNTAADGSGTSYAPGFQHALVDNLTLYAQWETPAPPPAPANPASATPLPTYYSSPPTGDALGVVLLLSIVLVIGITAGAAYALHRRRRQKP